MTSTDLPPILGLPPNLPCPDCEAPAGRWCYPDCPRFNDWGDDPAEGGDDGS